MQRVAIVDLDRPGLVAALAARGIDLASAMGDAHGVLLGWRQSAALIAETLDRLRQDGVGPVMILIAQASEAALIAALDAGADDTAPDSSSDAVIAARLAAMLRRARPAAISIGALRIDPVDRRVVREGRELALLPREYRLLMALARRTGATIDRATLLRQVCGIAFDPGTNVLDVHISRLRAKLDRGFAAPMLLTEKGRGFRLVAA